ncbi:MAG: 4a-hydroxytetrahydrobiopterin dehydratase [Pseudomonadota bacterium]
MSNLVERHCAAKPSAEDLLDKRQRDQMAAEIPQWSVGEEQLVREFGFADFHQTMAFVNALAWIAHREDHHPDLEVGYNRCLVQFTSHSAGGLTNNDFICAAKIDHWLDD